MVFSEVLGGKMAHERSKPLHNFLLPSLKWGNQRLLRCMKVDSNGDVASSSPDRRSEGGGGGGDTDMKPRDLNLGKRKKQLRTLLEFPETEKKKEEDSDDGIENLRVKLLLDLRTAEENMKISIRDQTDEKSDKQEDESGVGSASRPWNLRTRRAACKAPPVENGGGGADDNGEQRQGQGMEKEMIEKSPPKSLRLKGLAEMAAKNQGMEKSPSKTFRFMAAANHGLAEMAAANHGLEKQRNEKSSPKSLRLKGLAEMAANHGVEKERRKFSISLDRNEIKEDLLMMTGSNPSRRPKKRAKIIQNQLNNLFPGFWLTEVTSDSYRVDDELVEAKKK